MTEHEFWQIIELSWADSPELNQIRAEALQTNDEELLEKLERELGDPILENYTNRLLTLDKESFTQFLRIFEEKIYNLDREEVHEYTDGSDDGFLYCRFFILGMGEQYYQMVDKDPSKATMDLEEESFGFSAYGAYKKKFGEDFERSSVHSIETGSNKTGAGIHSKSLVSGYKSNKLNCLESSISEFCAGHSLSS